VMPHHHLSIRKDFHFHLFSKGKVPPRIGECIFWKLNLVSEGSEEMDIGGVVLVLVGHGTAGRSVKNGGFHVFVLAVQSVGLDVVYITCYIVLLPVSIEDTALESRIGDLPQCSIEGTGTVVCIPPAIEQGFVTMNHNVFGIRFPFLFLLGP